MTEDRDPRIGRDASDPRRINISIHEDDAHPLAIAIQPQKCCTAAKSEATNKWRERLNRGILGVLAKGREA